MKTPIFIYGYLLIAFAMFDLEVLKGTKLFQLERGILLITFKPWRVHKYANNIEYNDRSFKQWYV
jgi:hypothetical protein